MLLATRAQLEVFRAVAERGFVERLLRHLRTRFAMQFAGASDANLREVIQSCRRKAESHHILLEDDIRRFIECAITHGMSLDTTAATAWIGEILRRHDLSGTQKMDVIDSLELQRIRAQR